MGLVFAPSATAVLATMAPDDHAKASGTNSMLREVGVALGIAVSTAVFTGAGGAAARRPTTPSGPSPPCSWAPRCSSPRRWSGLLLPAGRAVKAAARLGHRRGGGARDGDAGRGRGIRRLSPEASADRRGPVPLARAGRGLRYEWS